MQGSIGEWLDMGGYAAYVWPVYGIAFAVLIGAFIHSLRSLRGEEAALDNLLRTIQLEREPDGEA